MVAGAVSVTIRSVRGIPFDLATRDVSDVGGRSHTEERDPGLFCLHALTRFRPCGDLVLTWLVRMCPGRFATYSPKTPHLTPMLRATLLSA